MNVALIGTSRERELAVITSVDGGEKHLVQLYRHLDLMDCRTHQQQKEPSTKNVENIWIQKLGKVRQSGVT